MSGPVVGIAGLTHLGLNTAAAIAAKGCAVIGYDPDDGLVARLGRGDLPVVEPGLPELVEEAGDRLEFSAAADDLGAADIVYIAADVPTDDAAASDLAPIERLIEAVAPYLGASAILVVLCQVPPGFTRGLSHPAERLFYQVETLVFGRAVERATRPERFIVGCADPARSLPAAYADLLGRFACPVLPMRYESAELAKIAINVCLVAQVTAANALAELSERIGADWREIVPALRLDRRIGEHAYIRPGLGIAGGNLERDLATVLRLAEGVGSDVDFVRSALALSRRRRDWALGVLHRRLLADRPGARVALLGLAYKENTHSTKNSPALALARALGKCELVAYDPAVAADSVGLVNVRSAPSALAAVTGADALAIMTPWPELARLAPADVASRMAGRLVVDPFAVLDRGGALAAGLEHHVLGAPPPNGG